MTYCNFKFIHAVTDQFKVARFEKMLALIHKETERFDKSKLTNRGWIAVPVESGDHLAPDQRQLIRQFYNDESKSLSGISIEEMGDTFDCLEIPITDDGLEEFSRCYGAFPFLLWDESDELTFSFTTGDYFSVAGHRTAIEALFGRKLSEIHTEFKGFASEFWTDPSDQVWVEELFRDFNLQ